MLVPCPSCGKRISDRAASCPFCRGAGGEAGRAGTVSQSPTAVRPARLESANVPIEAAPSHPAVVLAPPPVAPEALPAFERGDFIGDLFQVISTLGEGGFGIVYLARSLASNDIVALKTLRGELLRDAKTRALFQKEARIWIDLGVHPNLVRAKWVDEVSGRLYIAMEYVQAGAGRPNSLEGHLERGLIPLDKILRWSIEFCRGMEYAMSRGIRCHRDIKPANILIGSDGVVKISDFGIAGLALVPDAAVGDGAAAAHAAASDDPAKTVAGTVFGTPTHMSPEQFVDAASCDEVSDIYSFGVVLYQMASGGRLPFRPGPPPLAMRAQVGAYYWHAFRKLHTNATEGALESPLAAVVARSLKKARADRYPSFASLRADLEVLAETTLGTEAAPAAVRDETAKDWNAKGISLATLNRWAEALACYDQALAKEPLVAAIHSNRGNALRNLDRPEESLAAFDRAIELDPLHAPAWENKALLYAQARRNDEALSCIERSIALDPTVADAWVIKGVMLGRLNRKEEQLAAYDGALGIDPRNVSAWFNKANTLSGTNREIALQCLDSALAADPSHASAWDLKGTILAELGRSGDAVRCHQEAVRLGPQDARSSYNLGNAWIALGRFAEASAAYENATRLSPQTPIAWYNFALTRLRMGQHVQAIPLFERYLALDPPHDGMRQGAEKLLGELRAGRKPELGPIDVGSRVTPEESPSVDPQALPELQAVDSFLGGAFFEEGEEPETPSSLELQADPVATVADEPLPAPLPSLAKLNDEANAHCNARRLAESMSVVDQILKIEPRDERALNTKAITLFRLEKKDEACAVIAAAIDASPGELPVWFNKVLLEHGAGRLKEACRSAIDLVEIAQVSSVKSAQVDEARQLMAKLQAKGVVAIPRGHAGWLGLGYASMVARHTDAALDFFEKATLASPRNVEAHRWKSSALKDVKRADEALAVADRAIALAPNDPEVHHDRGVILAMLREFDQAVASFDRALDLNPNHVASLSDKGKYAGELGRHEIAMAALRRASALVPDHPAPWLNLALVADVLKRDEDALVAYEKFLERAKPEMKLQIESSKRRVEQLRARVAARKGVPLSQATAPKLAGPAPPPVVPEVRVPPRVASPPFDECLKRSEMARNQAVFDRALEFADLAIGQEPLKHQAWLAKADALFGLKRFPESAACAKKAIELQASLAPAWVRLAGAYEGMNALEPAREAWGKAVEFASPNVLNWNGLGLCLARLGRLEEALAAHDRSLAIDPRFSLGKFHKGMREADLGRRDAALKSLQQFLALAPPALAGLIQQARKRITELKA
jgi:tetratricopeptide (TPR) repeat protein